MRLLLDTNVFLWWLADDDRLKEAERKAIRDPENDVYLSSASIWEIVIKRGLGRLRVPEPASVAALRLGLQPLPITFEHAEATATLPALHADPFDRLLMAQARTESLTLVSYELRDPFLSGAWLSANLNVGSARFVTSALRAHRRATRPAAASIACLVTSLATPPAARASSLGGTSRAANDDGSAASDS